MNTTQAQQKSLDDAFVAPADCLEFRKCNMRLDTNIKPKEATFQVVLDALSLTLFYQAFLITTKDLGHSGDIIYVTDVSVDYLHQPLRAFATVINKCLSGKESRIDKFHLSRVLDEQHLKKTGADEETGTIPGVLDVPKYEYENEKSKSEGNEVVASEVVGVEVGVACCKRGLNNEGVGDGFSRFRSLFVKLDETEQLVQVYQSFVFQGPVEEVKTQLPKILPKAVSVFATPVIERNVTKSLKASVLARSSSQPKSTYEAAASLFEFELTKILLDKMEENTSHLRVDYKNKLYVALVESYNTNKDLFITCGEVFTLKRSRDDSVKDRDPSARSDQGTKRRKSSMKAESSKDSSHTVDDSRVQRDKEFDRSNNDEQLVGKEVSKEHWFKKPERPPTPYSDWNKRQHVDFRPP
nr:hypothetical protein [Tanacetum cinerariifolium]